MWPFSGVPPAAIPRLNSPMCDTRFPAEMPPLKNCPSGGYGAPRAVERRRAQEPFTAFRKQVSALPRGVGRSVVSSLLEKGKLGSKKFGSSGRVFLSDLESCLGKDRAWSLVGDLSTDKPRSDRPDEHTKQRALQSGKVAKARAEISENEVIVPSGLPKEDP